MKPSTALQAIKTTHAIALATLLMLVACSDKPSGQTSAKPAATNDSVFTEGLPMAVAGELALRGDCNMEWINGQGFSSEPYKTSSGSTVEITGWVLDTPSSGVPQTVFVRAASDDGKRVWFAPVSVSVDRSDVASMRGGNEAYRRSGYVAKIKTSGLPAGTYRLQVIYAGKSEKAICDNGRVIVIS
jgi:hypothetical protein